jgi:hypothetical protein
MRLGITIRMGAAGFHLAAPEGTVNLAAASRTQLRAVAESVSDAMDIPQEKPAAPRRRRRQQHHRTKGK